MFSDRSRTHFFVYVALSLGLLLSALEGLGGNELEATTEWASSVIAFSSQYGTSAYSASQATGEPDTGSYGDNHTAWAPKNTNGTAEFITLGFSTPTYATGVTVHETCGNGFVKKIEVRNQSTKAFETVWTGTDSTPRGTPADLSITFRQRAYLVDAVRITTDTNASPDWEQIDAVRLDGLMKGSSPAITFSNPNSRGIWITNQELMALPMKGTGWSPLTAGARQPVGTPNLSDADNHADTLTLAKALVGIRTSNPGLIKEARAAIMAAMGTEAGDSIGIARNLNAFVISADLIGLDPAQDSRFRAWLIKATRNEVYSDGRTLVQMNEARPNNWGLMAGASRAAADLYLGDKSDLARVAQVFRGWLGDRNSYAEFKYGGPENDKSWQIDPDRPVANASLPDVSMSIHTTAQIAF
jgi:hypothetical protein